VLLDWIQWFSLGRSVASAPDPRQVAFPYQPGQLTRGVAVITELACSSKEFHVSHATTNRQRTEEVGQICGWRRLPGRPVDSAASATAASDFEPGWQSSSPFLGARGVPAGLTLRNYGLQEPLRA
jgi:hypothetical protein